jgi:hypothetical protein
VFGESIG